MLQESANHPQNANVCTYPHTWKAYVIAPGEQMQYKTLASLSE